MPNQGPDNIRRPNCGRRSILAIAMMCTVAGLPYSAPACEGLLPDEVSKPGNDADDELLAILDANGAVIDDVIIHPGSIFDLENPKESGFLYRMANKLHITTKPEVIEQQMLFAPGDELSQQRVEETERLLRSNRFIQDARVTPLIDDDCNVDIEIDTSDTWTLMPKLSFSRSGGTNSTDLGIRDMNVLGRGVYVEAMYSTDVDRDTTMLKIVDKNVGDSWYRLHLDLQKSSDGYLRLIDFSKPFYALDSTDAHGFSYYTNQRIDSVYDLGDVIGEYEHKTRNYEIFRGWSAGLQGDHALRWTTGLAYDEHRFSVPDQAEGAVVPPEDRQLFYPFIGVEWLENKYEKTRNADQINRTEDFYLGTRIAARLGYASDHLGSDRSSWLVKTSVESGLGDLETRSFFVNGGLTSRVERGALHDFGLEAGARYYDRQSEKSLLFAQVNGFYGKNLDADHAVYLGGDTGLRGYPLRYQAGDKHVQVTLEQRYYTDWYPFRLFRVGGAVFFDAGRTWGESAYQSTNQGWLRDVGVGLRLGSTRSGLGNVVHVDLAYPLDGDSSIDNVQFIVTAKHGF
jgi:hypothetical protein